MAILPNPPLQPLDESDPDDYRPGSVWSGPLVDPVSPSGYVRDLSVILERIAPGDRIPLHRHGVDEAIVVESGEVELRLGGETRVVTGHSVVFVPAGVE
ncbi:MAG TPA: cupin domain-containing protein, partial [Gaiellaceae bacterium]|nr:cupin domain-containing protein [Gaiellaceae bacterium]